MNVLNTGPSPAWRTAIWRLRALFSAAFVLFGLMISAQIVTTISTNGTFTVPAGVSSISVYVYGAGGGSGGCATGGSDQAGGGGGGGACAVTTWAVSGGQVYTATIGNGGSAGPAGGLTPGGNGGTTTFTGAAGTITADGGTSGAGAPTNRAAGAGGLGATTGSGFTTLYTGGNGTPGFRNTSNEVGGAGGGGGGNAGNGGNGSGAVGINTTGGTGGLGTPTNTAPYKGANGTGATVTGGTLPGVAGVAPGGGAAGGASWNATTPGAVGGNGQVVVVYTAPPCTDPPSPGATLSTASVTCSAVNFTLSMSTPPIGSGLTYQWQSADDNAFSVNLTNLGTSDTQVTSITASTWFRCLVSCSGNPSVASTPLQVTLGGVAYCGSYCVPVTSTGCTDGDVIARVTLNTLDNNSGTGCPSGLLGYSNYTSNPLLTTTLQAGSSYGCTVYAGQYSEGYAAWIDYNDDGVFTDPGERVGSSVGQVAGSGSVGVLGSSATFPITLLCNPPLGVHRLRVRCMYNLNGPSVTPCTNNTFGETEDYVVTISAAVPCPAPIALNVSNNLGTSATLGWTLGCAESNWDVHFQAAGGGAPPPTPSDPGLTSTSLTVSTPTAGAYEFYVRANCGGLAGTSLWSGPFVWLTYDECAGALPLTVNAGGSCPGADVTGTTVNSTPG
ncbi:MAG TPA: GEVED domain-containing protein, partial [Flavobacteriales bacterium]|nr:GEVED domain-containing protein [Flavobacteriales bacterium]